MSDKTQKTSPSYPSISASDEPLFNIGVVSRITGVPIATIRVWERRYGFPSSERTEGGHRIYSEREVARIRWVKARVDDGMQASKAVHALEVTESQGRYPEPPRIDAPAAATSGRAALARFQQRLTSMLLAHDLDSASQVLGEVITLYSLDDLITQVMRPTLVDIGDGWADGRVTVATEHLASQFLRDRLLQWMSAGPTPNPVRPTVLACAPNEWHDLSLLMFGVMLRRRKWPVASLGQAVPLRDLAGFVQDTQPPAVVTVAMLEASAKSMVMWPETLPAVAETGRPAFCYAGRAFTEDESIRERVPGVFLGTSLEGGVARLDGLLRDATGVI